MSRKDGAIIGGGGSTIIGSALYPGYNPPSSPNALDDEFDATGLTGWTVWDPGSNFASAPTVANATRGLRLASNDPGPAQLAGIYKDAPAGDWTAYLRINATSQAQGGSVFGLMVAEDLDASPSTGNIAVSTLLSAADGPRCERNTWSAYNSPSFGTAGQSCPNAIWLRLRWVDSTKAFAAEYSKDGIGWFSPNTGATVASGLSAASKVGICILNNSAINPFIGYAKHFRVVSGSDWDAVLPTEDYE